MKLELLSKFSLVALSTLVVVAMAVAAGFAQSPRERFGIVGQAAPPLSVSKWINLPEEINSFNIEDTKGKVTYLFFFQSWCPGCHSLGFPTLKKLEEQFRDNDTVQFVAIQTTFEGHEVNTADKLGGIAKRYELKIPVGQSEGNSGTPEIMQRYRTGGTPWVVIVDQAGQVVFNDYHVDADVAAKQIQKLISKNDPKGNSKMTERAVLAGGCFWGMQDLIRKLPGVVDTRVGYTGGDVPNATYRNHGTHAEGIEIEFDPSKTSYRELLEFFFKVHDPTTVNQQGNDRGMSYRSAIYFTSDQQKAIALETIEDVNASGNWPGKVVTEVEAASDFWEAEPEHQDYLERIPNGYTCHFPRSDWVLPKRDKATK